MTPSSSGLRARAATCTSVPVSVSEHAVKVLVAYLIDPVAIVLNGAR